MSSYKQVHTLTRPGKTIDILAGTDNHYKYKVTKNGQTVESKKFKVNRIEDAVIWALESTT